MVIKIYTAYFVSFAFITPQSDHADGVGFSGKGM